MKFLAFIGFTLLLGTTLSSGNLRKNYEQSSRSLFLVDYAASKVADAVFESVFHTPDLGGVHANVKVSYHGQESFDQVSASFKMSQAISYSNSITDGADGHYDCESDEQGHAQCGSCDPESHRTIDTVLWKGTLEYISLVQTDNEVVVQSGFEEYTEVRSFELNAGVDLSEEEFGFRVKLPLLELCEMPGIYSASADEEKHYLKWFHGQSIHFKWSQGMSATSCEAEFSTINENTVMDEHEYGCITRLCDSMFFTEGHEKTIKFAKKNYIAQGYKCRDSLGEDLQKARDAKLLGQHVLEFETCDDGVKNAKSNPDTPFEATISYGTGDDAIKYHFGGLDNSNLDDHRVGYPDVFERTDNVNVFGAKKVEATHLTLTANDSDGWCVSAVKLDGKVLIDVSEESERFWLDSPCTADSYYGIPCKTEKIFVVYTEHAHH